MPNAELAYKVLDEIIDDPDSYDPEVWIQRAECGTKACFAGRTCLLSGDVPGRSDDDEDEDDETELVVVPWLGSRRIPVRAAQLLGIEYDPDDKFGHRLFGAANSIDDLRRIVAEIFGPRPTGGES